LRGNFYCGTRPNYKEGAAIAFGEIGLDVYQGQRYRFYGGTVPV
jgi:hypothetical protein